MHCLWILLSTSGVCVCMRLCLSGHPLKDELKITIERCRQPKKIPEHIVALKFSVLPFSILFSNLLSWTAKTHIIINGWMLAFHGIAVFFALSLSLSSLTRTHTHTYSFSLCHCLSLSLAFVLVRVDSEKNERKIKKATL